MDEHGAALLTTLRTHEPVCRVRLPDGEDAWLVTRYDDVRVLLADPRFSRNHQPRGDAGDGRPADRAGDRATRPAELAPETDRTFGMEGPPHAALRRLVARSFTARRVEALRPRIQEITDGLIGELRRLRGDRPDGAVDLVGHFAAPLPLAVICELLGVPAGDGPLLRTLSDTTLSVTAYPRSEVLEAWRTLFEYFRYAVVGKRNAPADDLLSALLTLSDETDVLTETELVYLAVSVLIGGHESTANAIGLGVWRLLQHPDQVAAIRQDPALVATAVEELLRYQPLGFVDRRRVATEDVELGGVTIRAGEMVLAGVMSANRDEDRFAEPDHFDVARTPNPHLAFGYGPHYCLGAALAQAELQIALGSLLRAFPGLRLSVPADQVRWRPGLMVVGLCELPVTW